MSKTIKQLESEFDVKNGIITNPGKFEGETLATPFYYEIMLDGEGDIIEIEVSERAGFDIDDKYNFVVVCESSDGFASLEWHESRESAEQSYYDLESDDDGNNTDIAEDDSQYDESESCSMCNGRGIPLGSLGFIKYFRCESCGWEFSR